MSVTSTLQSETPGPVPHRDPPALSRGMRLWRTIQYLGVLAGLCAVGALGHSTHWSFGFGPVDPGVPPQGSSPKGSVVRDDGPGWTVTFPDDNAIERSGIRTAPIHEAVLSERIQATGEVTYDQRLVANLASRVPGTVWRVLKHVGDPVMAGDVIALIDSAEVGQAKADFLSGLVAVESKNEILGALERITGSVPDRQIREARIALREARIRLHNARQRLTNLGLKIETESFSQQGDADRVASLQRLGLPDDLFQELHSTVTTSNLLPVTASFTGVVIRQDANVGESVEPGRPILEIADVRRMSIRLSVPAENATRLKLGLPVTFRPDGAARDVAGEIAWISTEVDPLTRTLPARVDLENPVNSTENGREERLLRAHTFGRGTITLRQSAAVPVVPASALVHVDRQPLVFVESGNRVFRRVDVELGVREGDLVELRGTELKPGQNIVVAGGHALKSECLLKQEAAAP